MKLSYNVALHGVILSGTPTDAKMYLEVFQDRNSDSGFQIEFQDDSKRSSFISEISREGDNIDIDVYRIRAIR